MNQLSPICLFTYNRLSETQQTIQALQRNYLAPESELFLFSDGAKDDPDKPKVDAVRRYLKSVNGFKSVVITESQANQGLANSIINGVAQVLEKYEKVIVLEDDLISAPNFLNFMNQALDFYQEEQKIQSVNGYSLSLKNKSDEVYFQIRPGSWGWATWKNRWNPEIFNKEKLKFVLNSEASILKQFKARCGADMPKMLLDSINNKNDSWYVRWVFDHFRNNRYSVFPAYSYIQNNGFNADGTHCKGINAYHSEPVDEHKIVTGFSAFKIPDQKITREFLTYFSVQFKILVRLKLLKTKSGRIQVLQEIKTRMKTSMPQS